MFCNELWITEPDMFLRGQMVFIKQTQVNKEPRKRKC